MAFVTRFLGMVKSPLEALLIIGLAIACTVQVVEHIGQEGGRASIGGLLVKFGGMFLVGALLILVIFSFVGGNTGGL